MPAKRSAEALCRRREDGSLKGRDRASAWARFTPAGPEGAPNPSGSNGPVVSF